ncbi:alpha/beta hydrolase [Candidatus Uabimicrobium sp. HlEnr_7]|uniref:alpha/beta hydrolase n=1 Tax=Candidatus Uabimicrobium helgolandensis TaxID=3095367 RepID=UPI003557C3C1
MKKISLFFKAILEKLKRSDWGKEGHLLLINPTQSKYMKKTPTVIVYLPPDYYLGIRRYPVLYAHDGQNLFDEKTSFVGEWYLDDNANALIKQKLSNGVIIVGVYNTGEQRVYDYTPTPSNCKYGNNEGGSLRAYGDFIVRELKPSIDRKFRTLRSRENTGLMGSSLGGLASFYLLGWYPQVFSKAACLSPSFWWDHVRVTSDIESKDLQFADDCKIYLDGGWLEGDDEGNMVWFMRKVYHKLKEQGLQDFKNIFYHEDPHGMHNESAWARRGKMPLLFLYGKFCQKIDEISYVANPKNDMHIIPLAKLAGDMIFTPLSAEIKTDNDSVAIIDNSTIQIKQNDRSFKIRITYQNKTAII